MSKLRGADRRTETQNVDDQVRLKPLLGVSPETYIPVFFITSVALIIAFVLFVPGVVRYGSVVLFTGTPEGGSIYLNDRRIGSTPLETFVPAGENRIRFEKPYFETHSSTITIPGRVFGTIFFPRRVTIHTDLVLVEPVGLARQALHEFSGWSLVEWSGRQYQFPPVLSDAIIDLNSLIDTEPTDTGTQYGSRRDEVLELSEQILEIAVAYTVTAGSARDLLRAALLHRSGGGAPGAGSLADIVQYIVHLENNSTGFPVFVAEMLDRAGRDRVTNSEWYSRSLSERYTFVASRSTEDTPQEITPRVQVVNDTEFSTVPGGSQLIGRYRNNNQNADTVEVFPHEVETDVFLIMTAPVSRRQYAKFIEANPEWRPDNMEQLIRRELVQDQYLRDWNDTNIDDRPVTYVSYHAAEAYARWFQDSLPASHREYTVRIPFEEEWEVAAINNASDLYPAVFRDNAVQGAVSPTDAVPGNLRIRHLLGNTWEWTGSWFRPASYLVRTEPYRPGHDHSSVMKEAQKTVRGGSWANQPGSIGIYTRGSQDPTWCTGFLGFRLMMTDR